MKTITLIGMMGSGKTTVAACLSSLLKLPVVDTDKEIELVENRSISDIFIENGESYFRKLEKNIIKTFLKAEPKILSIGGGAFEDFETRQLLLQNSTVIYLETSAQNIYERIKNDKTRPLLKNNMTVEKIEEIISSRCINYKKAHFIITTDNKDIEQIANEITGVI